MIRSTYMPEVVPAVRVTRPPRTVQGIMKAQAEEPPCGCMSGVMKGRPILKPPPTTEQLSSNTVEDCDGGGILKRNVAPLHSAVVGPPLTVSLELAVSPSPRLLFALLGPASGEHEPAQH